MTVARSRLCQVWLEQLGKTVHWGERGPNFFDCSGLIGYGLELVGVPGLRFTHNAQMLHDESPDLATFPAPTEPLAGDLCFYGYSAGKVLHVAGWLSGGKCVSADGASSLVTLEQAKASVTDRVRLHDDARFRRDLPYFSIHRNVWADKLDALPGAAP